MGEYEVSDYKNKILIKVGKELLTDHEAEDFFSVLEEKIENGIKELIIDFTDTKFIGSHGIGKLLKTHKELRDRRGKMYLVGLNHDLKSFFTEFRLNEFFQFFDTYQDVP